MPDLTNDIYQRIVAAKIYIDENYQETIDLEQISQKAFLFQKFASSQVNMSLTANLWNC